MDCFKIISLYERSSLPSKKFLCISMGMLHIGALSLVGRLFEAKKRTSPPSKNDQTKVKQKCKYASYNFIGLIG